MAFTFFAYVFSFMNKNYSVHMKFGNGCIFDNVLDPLESGEFIERTEAIEGG